MSKISIGWAVSQLLEAEVPDRISAQVLALLEAVDFDQDAPDNEQVLNLFVELAQGHSIAVSNPEELWVAGVPGEFSVGDSVRIKRDAFSDDVGEIHNGRLGRVVSIRYGDIIVNSTDSREPKLEGAHYSAYNLERRVR